ncbi:MAG: hypothetical protein AB7F19_02250 [Candidatus Babeliales bacterium]
MKQKLLILIASTVMTLSSVNAEPILNPQRKAEVTEVFQNLNTNAPDEAKQYYKLWYTNFLTMSDLYIQYADLVIQDPEQANNELKIKLFNDMASISLNFQSKILEICLEDGKRNRVEHFDKSTKGRRLHEITGCLDYVLESQLATICDKNCPLRLEERRAAVIELKNHMLSLKNLVE